MAEDLQFKSVLHRSHFVAGRRGSRVVGTGWLMKLGHPPETFEGGCGIASDG